MFQLFLMGILAPYLLGYLFSLTIFALPEVRVSQLQSHSIQGGVMLQL